MEDIILPEVIHFFLIVYEYPTKFLFRIKIQLSIVNFFFYKFNNNYLINIYILVFTYIILNIKFIWFGIYDLY